MKIENRLRPVWSKWNGVIPVWAAEQAGVKRSDLLKWADDNPDVDVINSEVLTWYPDYPESESFDWDNRSSIISLAEAGPDAYLWGPSVVELSRLGTWGSGITFLATPKKQPKKTGIYWIVTGKKADNTIDGLPAQSIKDAIVSSVRYLDSDKFAEVLEDASNQSIISNSERSSLEKANADGYISDIRGEA